MWVGSADSRTTPLVDASGHASGHARPFGNARTHKALIVRSANLVQDEPKLGCFFLRVSRRDTRVHAQMHASY